MGMTASQVTASEDSSSSVPSLRHDVEFPGFDGTTLRGWLYLPASAAGRHPGVVMAHGFSATKEMALDRYSEILCQGGIAVLTYDHRCLGASDGEPRQLIDPWAQARDYLAALDWLAERQEVDPDRLGVWGSSFSGGEAIVVGAVDHRVRAVVANVPFVGRPGDPPASSGAFAQLSARVRAARQADGTGLIGPLGVVREAGADGSAVMPQAEAAEWFLRAGRHPGSRWVNRAWLLGRTGLPDFDPAVALPQLQVPALFVLTSADRIAPTPDGLAAFALVPDPKELLVIDGHHFTPYSGDALVRSATAAREFYGQWL